MASKDKSTGNGRSPLRSDIFHSPTVDLLGGSGRFIPTHKPRYLTFQRRPQARPISY